MQGVESVGGAKLRVHNVAFAVLWRNTAASSARNRTRVGTKLTVMRLLSSKCVLPAARKSRARIISAPTVWRRGTAASNARKTTGPNISQSVR